MYRLVIVAKWYEPELRQAVSAAALAFGGSLAAAPISEVYEYITRHLAVNRVPYDDCRKEPGEVPDTHVYFQRDGRVRL